MADENEVSVDVTVPVPEDPDETSHDETAGSVAGAATDHVIDAAVESEVAARQADSASVDAQIAALDATGAAAEASESASRIDANTAALAQVAADLREATANLAKAAAGPSTNLAAETLDDVTEPELEVEPEQEHWLSKKWFSKKDKGVSVK